MTAIRTPLGDPYSGIIELFFQKEFPQIVCGNKDTLLEIVTDALIATSQVRYGPVPNPESLVNIRSIIRDAIEHNAPIPILVPFGSRKSELSGELDIAEVCALRTLSCLQERVQAKYAPGIQVNMRVEDASGHYLFADEGNASRLATKVYCHNLVTLIKVLGYDSFIRPILESSMFDEELFKVASDRIVPALIAYIEATDEFGLSNYENLSSWKNLKAFGWKGNIPAEQRAYYRQRYHTLYPDISEHDATVKLARYFAGSWARIQLKGTGVAPEWGSNYIRLTFVPPVPGSPKELVSTNIYYRTVPLKFASTHIPPWRARGYLRLNGEVTPKLASWKEPLNLHSCLITLDNGEDVVPVRCDYVIED